MQLCMVDTNCSSWKQGDEHLIGTFSKPTLTEQILYTCLPEWTPTERVSVNALRGNICGPQCHQGLTLPQPREDDVLTQMDFALFGGALSLLGQHIHLLDYSPEQPRECQASPGARKRSEKDPRLSCRFEIPWEDRR
ncbi:hypothetical protein DV515_00008405, partial [Chloebia gouldiae]